MAAGGEVAEATAGEEAVEMGRVAEALGSFHLLQRGKSKCGKGCVGGVRMTVWLCDDLGTGGADAVGVFVLLAGIGE